MTRGADRVRVRGARQHNLRDVDVDVPRRAITVFTGVSGSGKTSLVLDTIAAEAQRQLGETFSPFVRNRLPSRGRPEVDDIAGLSPVVLVDQKRIGGGVRSTVGTVTDIGASLRLLFSRASDPHVGESTAFSFNDPTGMCLVCSGIGEVVEPDPDLLYDPDLSVADGAIQVPGYRPGQWAYRRYVDVGVFDLARPVGAWSAAAREVLLRGQDARRSGTKPLRRRLPPDYEPLLDRFERIYVRASGEANRSKRAVVERLSTRSVCPACGGDRLNDPARTATVDGHTLPELSRSEIGDLVGVIRTLDVPPAVRPVAEALADRLGAVVDIGLGYLDLARGSGTLSGGESQRLKLIRHLGSSLTEMLYVFDEPSVGLHPADLERLIELLRELRDHGNTLLVVEHDPQVMAMADHVVDLGPEAGARGGTIVFTGTWSGLRRSKGRTGQALRARPSVREPRTPRGWLRVDGVSRNNVHDIDVAIPRSVLTAVTGVAGSGKSSVMAEVLDHHPGTMVDQRPLSTGRRSLVATWLGIADHVRTLFAEANGVSATLFSPNAKPEDGGGACPQCRGLGVVFTDLAFMEGFSSTCDLCHGRRFRPDVLERRLDGRSIADVLELDAEQAATVFSTVPAVGEPLRAVVDVGLGYLRLGQSLTTVSGGEGQRLRLARELQDVDDVDADHGDTRLYLLDEPTTGLHLADTTRLLGVLDRLVERGDTVVVIEHDLDVIRQADWIIDVGPGAGSAGGTILYTGTPTDLAAQAPPTSATARYL